MSPTSDPSKTGNTQSAFNLTLVAVAGQVGCLTLIIVLAALFGGLWLDARFATRPMFTIGLMIASVPVTLVMMFWVVRAATSRIKNTQPANMPDTQRIEEENRSGRKE